MTADCSIAIGKSFFFVSNFLVPDDDDDVDLIEYHPGKCIFFLFAAL